MKSSYLVPTILDYQISMSNIAARNAHGFTLREKRLFAAGVSKINPHYLSKEPLKISQILSVTAKEYAEISGINRHKDAYKDMKMACDNLFNRYLRQIVKTSRGLLRERKIRWVSGVEYHEGDGRVSFTLTNEIMPHVSMLMGNFTSYRLRQTSELRSVYSWRLLEFLTSYLDSNNTTKSVCKIVTLEEFKYIFEVPNGYRYDHIKRRVIIPSSKELVDKDGWDIQWQPIKSGRSVTSIKFIFFKKPQGDLFRQ